MSDMYDDDPRAVPPPRASSLRTRIVVLVAVGLAVFFFLLTTFASLWTDHLWFESVHYNGVFTRLPVRTSCPACSPLLSAAR